MFISETTRLYPRDDDGQTISKQNIIIIAVCASVAFLVLVFALFRMIRNCRRSSSAAPLPPPQPLAHQREQQVALFEQSAPRVTTWYQPQPAAHPIRPSSLGAGSKASLLGKESTGVSPSIPPSTESMHDVEVPSHSSLQHLPLPNSSIYPPRRPSSRSSFNSSDASCTPPLSSNHSSSPDATASPSPTPARYSRYTRHTRPLSMSSTYTYGTTNSRSTSRVRGVPHAPHNQIQIVLPTPLASANNSKESLAIPRGRLSSVSVDRRSIADPWINLSSGTYGIAHRSTESLPETLPKTPRRRPASISTPAMSMPPVLYEGRTMVPPVPPLPRTASGESTSLNISPQRSGTKGRVLEKRRMES